MLRVKSQLKWMPSKNDYIAWYSAQMFATTEQINTKELKLNLTLKMPSQYSKYKSLGGAM